MKITERCLKCLQTQDWNELNSILSDEKNCLNLGNDPIFSIFEKAGLKLIRLRKKQNKKMLEVFELYLNTM